jgi:predicted phage terminase large subunit-like protein
VVTSKFFPAWLVGTKPDTRVVLASYGSDFSEKWGREAKALIEEHGMSVFGIRLNPDSSSAARWDIQDHEGGMVALGVGGPLTGRGADCFLIDDPTKNAEEANSALQREKIWQWFQSVAYTRLEPGASIVVVMARWHEDDLVGRLLNSEDDWTIVSLPARAESDDILGRHEGQPLWPERYSLEELASIKRTVGSYTWAALYQGSPVPAGGNILQRSWFRYWRKKDQTLPPVAVRLPEGETVEHNAVELPEKFDEVIQSWDLAFKESATSDYVVGQVWGIVGADRYLLDQTRARMDFPKTIHAIRRLTEKWPNTTRKLVEEKASGSPLLDTLKHEISGLIPINPTTDKVSRVHAISAQIESGNVYLPHPHSASWVEPLIIECVSFPAARHDDAVDAMSQALSETLKPRRKLLWA